MTEVRNKDCARRFAMERNPSCQHLVSHDPERVLVGAGTKWLARCLFRSHVFRRAEYGPTGGGLPYRTPRVGQTKVRGSLLSLLPEDSVPALYCPVRDP